MHTLRLLPLACLLWAGTAYAQSTVDCPTLPADSGLAWDRLDSADFTFCKAIRASDATQLFAVMIAEDSPFRPNRGDRAEPTVIDGREAHWYRSELAGSPDILVRETLIELDRDRVAHISFRAADEEQLAQTIRAVEGIRFEGTRLSSN